MATPSPIIADKRYFIVPNIGVETIAFVTGEGANNFLPPDSIQTTNVKQVIDEIIMFKIPWSNDTVFYGSFYCNIIDTSAPVRGNTYGISGKFHVKQINTIKTINKPMITQSYDTIPLILQIVDVQNENVFAFRIKKTQQDNIKMIVSLSVFVSKIDISSINDSQYV